MDLSSFIVLIPCFTALVVGFLIKKTAGDKIDRFVPLILAGIGLLINMWVNLSITPEILIEGLISGIAAMGMFDMIKGFAGEKKEEDK
ncbi:MAG: holin [Ruminococcaceae bacterium]|nr:holin [Oscillospiraceae bacterium]